MCGQREDAEEVAQETLLRVFESFDRLREPERVRSWVFRIARNACLMKRRKSAFAPSRELSLDEFLQLHCRRHPDRDLLTMLTNMSEHRPFGAVTHHPHFQQKLIARRLHPRLLGDPCTQVLPS